MQTTRYQRVKEILDAAAGKSPSDYGGRGPFWQLPLPDFLDAEVHGIRMIATEEEAEGCPCCVGDGPGRGAKSGLVRGLRGEAPFDGTRFPALPWGGRPVAERDITFISDWIDGGCKPDDHSTSLPVTGKTTEPELAEIEAKNVEEEVRKFEVYEGSPNEVRAQYGALKQRMNIDCLPEPEVEKYRLAFRELYRLNKWPEDRRSYNNMALIHQNHCQHGWERFLPWHRVYLYEFEQVLQDVAPGMTMPYWDWTMAQYRPSKAQNGWIIPEAYQAFLREDSIVWLTEKAVPKISKAAGAALMKNMVDKGRRYARLNGVAPRGALTPTFFEDVVTFTKKTEYAEPPYRDRFIDALLAANSLWYPLRYPAQYPKGGTIEQTVNYHYPTGRDIAQILSLRTFRDFGGGSFYDDSFGFLDQNPHNTMHLWTGAFNPDYKEPKTAEATDLSKIARGHHRNRGVQISGRRFHTREDMYTQPKFGDMFSNLTASYDPVFWPIHVNVDRLWVEWQQRNPHSLPADLTSVLTPWSYTIHDTLEHARFGYEYVKCSFLVPVGLSTPVGRFVSKPIEIPAPARKDFRQAEVRLHRVPQLPRSCFIRVFLNLPDADAGTSIRDPHYAGYLAVFGHGDCYGGPGHCDLPPLRPRQHDLRPRNHNTPRNHRVDVTKTARKLLGAGAKSLQITLVVIGADYREDSDLLRLDGVSLDFLD